MNIGEISKTEMTRFGLLWRRLLMPWNIWRGVWRDKRRLEVLLEAAPAAFCGWNHDGTLALSPDFCALLGLADCRSIEDIEKLLTPSDAIALRDHFLRLRKYGQGFTITARLLQGERCFQVRGSRSTGLEPHENFDILWLTEITEDMNAAAEEVHSRIAAEQQRMVFEAALDHIPYPVWMRDAEGKVSWVNRSYMAMLDIGQRDTADYKKEPGLLLKAQLWDRARESGQMQSHKGHMVMQGERRLVEISEAYLQREDMFIGALIDLTSIEELEDELSRHIQAHAEVLESIGSAIAIYGQDQKLRFFNSAYQEILGLEEDWLEKNPTLGEVLEKLRETRKLPEVTDFQSYKREQQEMFTSLIEPMETLLHQPDGRTLRQMVTPHPSGGILVTLEDVSSRLVLESNYNTLIAVQRETLDNLAEGLVVIGGDGRLKLYNPAYSRMWKLSEADMEGEPHVADIVEKIRDFFDPGQSWEQIKRDMIVETMDRQARTGRIQRMDGTVIDYATVPLPDGAILSSFLDVSDSVHVEQALREKNTALEATDRLKTEFLANVSYKLRTPLNAVMGFAEMLRQRYFGDLNPRQTEYIDLIMEASSGLKSLVDDILDLATIEAGYMVLERKETDLTALFAEIGEYVQDWPDKHQLALQFKIPKNIGKAELDAGRIRQVILNLLSNAVTFTPSGGQITVSARRQKDELQISVQDNGVGIPVQDQQRIFGLFERAGRPEQGQAGAGLGLSLVKSFVELHGGWVELHSKPGEGTRIICHLPLTAKIAKIWEEQMIGQDGVKAEITESANRFAELRQPQD